MLFCIATTIAVALSPTTSPLNPVLRSVPHTFRSPAVRATALEDDACVDEVCVTTNEPADKLTYSEDSRKFRRTVYMHDEWVKHRSTDRFAKNVADLFKSGVVRALYAELIFTTSAALFVVLANCILVGYTDLSGVAHPAVVEGWFAPKGLTLPALPFSIALPALSLLLVFRTNTAYFRWNEGRTLWGAVINTCRNVVRQANMYFPNDEKHDVLREDLAAQTVMFCKSLRCFLRGPTDEPVLYSELLPTVGEKQASACLSSANKPMFAASAMSTTLARANIDPIYRARIDTSIAQLVDLCGANERIFKSPIPLVYTRHTARFLTCFLVLLPLALWEPMGNSWNHWATVPVTFFISLFLFGIEEIGIQIEEPFGILPLEALCNGAIEATIKEMMAAQEKGDYKIEDLETTAPFLAQIGATSSEISSLESRGMFTRRS